MAQISLNDLTFYHDGSFDNIFEFAPWEIWHDVRFREKIATKTIELQRK